MPDAIPCPAAEVEAMLIGRKTMPCPPRLVALREMVARKLAAIRERKAWRLLRTQASDLAAAISDFEAALPGWWWSVGACSVSRDASCGPDRAGPDAHLLKLREFDEGFHHDGSGDVADSLRIVMEHALQRRRAFPANIDTPEAQPSGRVAREESEP